MAAVIDARELLIEIGRKRIRGLTKVCYFLVGLLLLESAGFLLFIHHCGQH